MRKQLLVGCESLAEARRLAPWAAIRRKVDGGYMAFESVADFKLWLRQS